MISNDPQKSHKRDDGGSEKSHSKKSPTERELCSEAKIKQPECFTLSDFVSSPGADFLTRASYSESGHWPANQHGHKKQHPVRWWLSRRYFPGELGMSAGHKGISS